MVARNYRIPPEAIATIGDTPNGVLLLAYSRLSIAMGNASLKVSADADLYPDDDDTALLADAADSPGHDQQPKEFR